MLPTLSFQNFSCPDENVTNFCSFLPLPLNLFKLKTKLKGFCVCRTGATETSFLLSRPTLRNKETTLQHLLLGALLYLNLGDFWPRRRIRLLRARTQITTLMDMAERKGEKTASGVYFHCRQTSAACKNL